MTKLFTKALEIKNLFGVAIVSLIVVYAFKDNIQALALAGKSDSLNLILGFLSIMLIGLVGMTAYYAIAEKEIEKGSVSVKGSEGVKTRVKGGGSVDVRDSKDVDTEIDNSGSGGEAEKKT